MNQQKNNSLFSTAIFLCIAVFIILGIVLITEEPVPTQTSTTNGTIQKP